MAYDPFSGLACPQEWSATGAGNIAVYSDVAGAPVADPTPLHLDLFENRGSFLRCNPRPMRYLLMHESRMSRGLPLCQQPQLQVRAASKMRRSSHHVVYTPRRERSRVIVAGSPDRMQPMPR
jgi:hypothetical protein